MLSSPTIIGGSIASSPPDSDMTFPTHVTPLCTKSERPCHQAVAQDVVAEGMVREDFPKGSVDTFRTHGILLPTFDELAHPEQIPFSIHDKLKTVDPNDINPLNLFRIGWKNTIRRADEELHADTVFGKVNYIEVPRGLHGLKARVIVLLGDSLPTKSHKVGATFGTLVSKIVHGDFDPSKHVAVWPSTGNYCRGGAFNSCLMGCDCISILPSTMSKERFEWLERIGSTIIPTAGKGSKFKELFEKVKELKDEMGDRLVVLNQFCEFGNAMWHYHVTGPAMEEVFQEERRSEDDRIFGVCVMQGSGGTLGGAYYLKDKVDPRMKLAVGEATQCPALMLGGYGHHRIEGTGDNHVPWSVNVKKIDMIVEVDDDLCMRTLRLFNEEAGIRHLTHDLGLDESLVARFSSLGISSIANILSTIKMAKYYECNENDILFTVATDSAELYASRLEEMRMAHGVYKEMDARIDAALSFQGLTLDHIAELSHYDRKRIHNMKYFTWIEQQGKDVKELDEQWHSEKYWRKQWESKDAIDDLIRAFNAHTGLQPSF